MAVTSRVDRSPLNLTCQGISFFFLERPLRFEDGKDESEGFLQPLPGDRLDFAEGLPAVNESLEVQGGRQDDIGMGGVKKLGIHAFADPGFERLQKWSTVRLGQLR